MEFVLMVAVDTYARRRQTSINASRAVAWQDKEAIQPLVMRKQQIDDFVRKHKIDVSLSKFYASQFSMAKS
jgi:hypothetical protein